jgi:ribosomal protein L1
VTIALNNDRLGAHKEAGGSLQAMKHGKKYHAAYKKVDKTKEYSLVEAIEFLKANKISKFDETLEIAVVLGIDQKKSEQAVRGSVVLPHGLGKTTRVLVFAQGDRETEAKEAGADFVGGDDLAKKITEGWLDFDAVVAAPDMMKVVGKLGKILGTRGLMPNPKTGTVTMEVGKAVKDLKILKSIRPAFFTHRSANSRLKRPNWLKIPKHSWKRSTRQSRRPPRDCILKKFI